MPPTAIVHEFGRQPDDTTSQSKKNDSLTRLPCWTLLSNSAETELTFWPKTLLKKTTSSNKAMNIPSIICIKKEEELREILGSWIECLSAPILSKRCNNTTCIMILSTSTSFLNFWPLNQETGSVKYDQMKITIQLRNTFQKVQKPNSTITTDLSAHYLFYWQIQGKKTPPCQPKKPPTEIGLWIVSCHSLSMRRSMVSITLIDA